MQKLRFALEYHCDPVWVLDRNRLVNAGLPEDLMSETKLVQLLKDISADYDSAFIDTSVEFSYKGFPDKEKETEFDKKLFKAIELLKKAAADKYEVEIDSVLTEELSYLTDN